MRKLLAVAGVLIAWLLLAAGAAGYSIYQVPPNAAPQTKAMAAQLCAKRGQHCWSIKGPKCRVQRDGLVFCLARTLATVHRQPRRECVLVTTFDQTGTPIFASHFCWRVHFRFRR